MPGLQPEDVYALTGVGDPRISPDGTRVAYVVTAIDREANRSRSAIWVAPLDGSEDPRRFTAGERRDGSPRWSPDGHWLAFVSNRGDDKAEAQIYVIPAAGGEARRLTDLKESAEEIAWSPDSTRIAFSARVRDEAYDEEDEKKRRPRRITRLFFKLDGTGWTTDRRKHVFVVDLEGGEPRQVTSGDGDEGSPAWTADGKRLLVGGVRGEHWDTELITRFYSVDANGGEPEQLTGDDATFEAPAFSPDGTRLAYHFTLEDGTYPHHTQVGVMNADGSDPKLLTASLDRQCSPYPDVREPGWDGDRLLFSVEDGGNVHLYAVAADGASAPELLVGGEQAISSFDVHDGNFVYVSSTSTTMRELHAADGRRLTDVGASFAADRELSEPERFTAVSPDGYEVDAWVMRPPGFEAGKRYPALLNIHGGPFSQYGTGFFDEFQVYAGGGYVV
ncbi:MAG: S9 family peptidase, partial [Gaiellaceae bacterium]